uniref:MULE domain-containing protein n=1 Tax=Strongyloides papillosus TaxID=174720 RepID=A0A0N5C9K3_STREA
MLTILESNDIFGKHKFSAEVVNELYKLWTENEKLSLVETIKKLRDTFESENSIPSKTTMSKLKQNFLKYKNKNNSVNSNSNNDVDDTNNEDFQWISLKSYDINYDDNIILTINGPEENFLNKKGYSFKNDEQICRRYCNKCNSIRSLNKEGGIVFFGQKHFDNCLPRSVVELIFRLLQKYYSNMVSTYIYTPISAYKKLMYDLNNILKKENVCFDDYLKVYKIPEKVSIVNNFRKLNTVPLEIVSANDNNIIELKENNIIIYFDHRWIQKICSSEYIIMDGTFKSCPNHYAQLYAIHIVDSRNRISYSVFYAILPAKDEEAYKVMLQYFKSIVGNLRSVTFIIDKEFAMMSALTEIFNESYVKICLWHYRRAICKKLRSCSLLPNKNVLKNILKTRSNSKAMEEYDNKVLLKKMVFNFPFIKKEDMALAYTTIISPLCRKIKNGLVFSSYFLRNWVEGRKSYNNNMICHYDTEIRTTSVAESFHSALNRSSLIATKPSLKDLLNVLHIIDNESLMRAQYMLFMNQNQRVLCEIILNMNIV